MVMTIIILALVFLFFALSKRLYTKNLNPLSAWVGIWGVATFLYINSDFISHNLAFKSVFIYVSGFAFFVIGVLFNYLVYGKRLSKEASNCYYLKAKQTEKTILDKIINFGFWFAVIDLLFLLVFVGAKVGILRFFSAMIHYYESDFSPGGFLNIFYTLFLYSKRVLICFSLLCVIYVIRYRQKVLRSFITILINILICISYSRTLIFYLIVLIAICAYFSISDEKGIKFRHILFVLLTLLFFYFYFTYSQNELNKMFGFNGTVLGLPLSDSAITFLSYFIGTFKSSDFYLETMSTPYPLIGTLRFVYELFGVNTTKYFTQDFVNIPFMYNTANIQFYLYYEGGFIWLIFALFIFGFLASKAFLTYEKNKGALDVVLVSMVFLGIFFSIRSYMIIYLDYLLPLLTVFALKVWTSRRLKKQEVCKVSHRNIRNVGLRGQTDPL